MQLAIGIVQYYSARDFQDFAGGGKFLAPQRRQFLIAVCASAVGGGLSRGQAGDAGFYSPLPVNQQGSAEAAGFVIWMSGYDHHAEHERDCTFARVAPACRWAGRPPDSRRHTTLR